MSDGTNDVMEGFIDRAPVEPSEADKAALDRLDIRDPDDIPHVDPEPENEAPLSEASQQAIIDAQAWGFSPDEAKVLAEAGLVTRIRTMRESLESKAAPDTKATAPQPQAETTDPGGSGSPDADLAKTVAAMQAELAALRGQVGRVPDAVDDHIVASGHEQLFGKGRWVEPDSAHAENRRLVKESVDTLRAGYRAQGKAVPPDTELVRRAVQMQFGDELRNATPVRVQQRQNSFIARATSRNHADLPPGVDKATASVAAKLREFGI